MHVALTETPLTLAYQTAASSSSTTSSAAPSGTPAAGADQDGKKDDSSSSGLSQAAVIGIAVGVSVVGIAAIAVAICLCLKRRKRKQPTFIEISKPIPLPERRSFGGGRDLYPEKRRRNDDIEMTTNRYEDMVPRTEPRTMV
jgi:hypothetical protein